MSDWLDTWGWLPTSTGFGSAYFGRSAAGRSELNISTATSHRPSGYLRRTVTNLPEFLNRPQASRRVRLVAWLTFVYFTPLAGFQDPCSLRT